MQTGRNINLRGVKNLIQDNILLLALLSLGLIFNNNLVAAGAGGLLVLKLVKMQSILLLLERRAMDIGLLFLLVFY